jgi:uncharacterized integral membrane protein
VKTFTLDSYRKFASYLADDIGTHAVVDVGPETLTTRQSKLIADMLGSWASASRPRPVMQTFHPTRHGEEHAVTMTKMESGEADRAGLGGGTIATLSGLGVLALFMVQNTEDVRVSFLVWDFTWPIWLLTRGAALLGALVWFGVGVLRRHPRRKARRD